MSTEWVRANAAAFRRADALFAEVDLTAREAETMNRFHLDPVFHARVFTTAQAIAKVQMQGRKMDDRHEVWAQSLAAAVTAITMFELLGWSPPSE